MYVIKNSVMRFLALMNMHDFNDNNDSAAIDHDVILWKAYYYNVLPYLNVTHTGAFANPTISYGWIYPNLLMVLMIVCTYCCVSASILCCVVLCYVELCYLILSNTMLVYLILISLSCDILVSTNAVVIIFSPHNSGNHITSYLA